MKVKILTIGKSQPAFVVEGIDFFHKKIKHFCDFEWIELIVKKKTELKDMALSFESETFKQQIEDSDYVILLDERGKSFSSSIDFSEFLNKKQIAGHKRIIFLIGGAYGFDETIYQRANEKVSLSSMTFSHQMIRLIFLEQLYRGFSILKHLPYHHE